MGDNLEKFVNQDKHVKPIRFKLKAKQLKAIKNFYDFLNEADKVPEENIYRIQTLLEKYFPEGYGKDLGYLQDLPERIQDRFYGALRSARKYVDKYEERLAGLRG